MNVCAVLFSHFFLFHCIPWNGSAHVYDTSINLIQKVLIIDTPEICFHGDSRSHQIRKISNHISGSSLQCLLFSIYIYLSFWLLGMICVCLCTCYGVHVEAKGQQRYQSPLPTSFEVKSVLFTPACARLSAFKLWGFSRLHLPLGLQMCATVPGYV